MEIELNLKRWQPKPKGGKFNIHSTSAGNFTPARTRHYAGMFGDAPETEPKRAKTGKGDKGGDGAGGGADSGMSALKTTKKASSGKRKTYGKIKTGKDSNTGLGNGPERRGKKMWVPVERRQKP